MPDNVVSIWSYSNYLDDNQEECVCRADMQQLVDIATIVEKDIIVIQLNLFHIEGHVNVSANLCRLIFIL